MVYRVADLVGGGGAEDFDSFCKNVKEKFLEIK